MLKISLFILAGILVAGIGWIGASFWLFARTIDGEVEALRQAALPVGEVVSEARLAELPAPLQRHLRQAGVVGTTIPRLVTVTQAGRMRGTPDAGWMDFAAVETYSTNPPGFVWRVWFPSRSLPVVFGRDHYLDGDGRITMKMLGTFEVASAGGGELNAAALMRYFNETMWFPAALAGRNFSYEAVDDTSVDATLTDRGMRLMARLFFDEAGRLVNFSTPRYDLDADKMHTWETPLSKYGAFAGMNVPVAGQGVWQRPDGAFAYIELNVTGITLE